MTWTNLTPMAKLPHFTVRNAEIGFESNFHRGSPAKPPLHCFADRPLLLSIQQS